MGAWVTGHNMAGYMPESDTYASAEWDDAVATLRDEMTQYADEDDESTWEALPTDPEEATAQGYTVTGSGQEMMIDYGDDAPSMRATVDSIFGDGDGPTSPGDWSCTVKDGSGRRIAFWVMWSDDRDPDES